jgi:hypothetical protein
VLVLFLAADKGFVDFDDLAFAAKQIGIGFAQ